MDSGNWPELESIATAYAAIVATAAFSLQIGLWWSSRPKLIIRLTPNGQLIGATPELSEKDLCIVHVTNRGSAPTTIDNLVLWEMPTLWRRLRRRPTRSFVIPNPQALNYPANVPHELEPNRRWTGFIRKRQDTIADLQNGNFYVAISASHSDRHTFKRIPRRHKQLPKGTVELK